MGRGPGGLWDTPGNGARSRARARGQRGALEPALWVRELRPEPE